MEIVCCAGVITLAPPGGAGLSCVCLAGALWAVSAFKGYTHKLDKRRAVLRAVSRTLESEHALGRRLFPDEREALRAALEETLHED